MLLVLLLIYDIFFVFITPLFSAGKSIMVEVATGKSSAAFVLLNIIIFYLIFGSLQVICMREGRLTTVLSMVIGNLELKSLLLNHS